MSKLEKKLNQAVDDIEKDYKDLVDAINSFRGIDSSNLNNGNIVSYMIFVSEELSKLNSKINFIFRYLESTKSN